MRPEVDMHHLPAERRREATQAAQRRAAARGTAQQPWRLRQERFQPTRWGSLLGAPTLFALLLLTLAGCSLTARLHHDAPTPAIAPLVTPHVEAEDRPRCHENNLRCACALWALGQLIGEEQYEATQAARQPPQMNPEAHRLSDAEAQATFEKLDAASRCKDCRTGARGFATQPGAKPWPVPVDADGWPLADLDVKPPVCNGSQLKASPIPAPSPTPAGPLAVGPGSDSAPCLSPPSLADFFLHLRSPQTWAAVETGGQW